MMIFLASVATFLALLSIGDKKDILQFWLISAAFFYFLHVLFGA